MKQPTRAEFDALTRQVRALQQLAFDAELRRRIASDQAKPFDDLLKFGYCLHDGEWLHLLPREHLAVGNGPFFKYAWQPEEESNMRESGPTHG